MVVQTPSKLSWKLLASILPLVILAVSVIVWLQYNMARREILSAINKETQFLAQRMATGLDDLLEQRRRDLFSLAETPLIADYYRNVDFHLDDEAESYRRELGKYLSNFSRRNGVYARVLYIDSSGREVSSVGTRAPGTRTGHAQEEYFLKAREAAPGRWWASSIVELEGFGPVVYYAKPVRDELREFKGVLVLCYDLSQLRRLLRNVEMGRRGRAYIQTADGRRLEGRPRVGKDEELLAAASSMQSRPWSVVVEAPMEDFLGPLRSVKNTAVLTSLLGLAVLVVVILLLVRTITSPIASLVLAARRIGGGDLGYRIRTIGHDEVGTLSAAFNEMAAHLEDNLKRNVELQGQLIQAEKLSAVGQLISAVAHELNNPLQSISGYIQNALHVGCPPQMREDLSRVFKNVFRCRKVVDNLLFFVRQSGREQEKVDLNRAVESALELLEYRLSKTEGVVVVKDFSQNSPKIIGDFQQVVQVLINIISNACDAMREAVRYPAQKRLSVRTGLAAGKVFVEIEDNGPGVPPELREKIFQPFFTTKEAGRGTGLGLSICFQIVRDHGGDIGLQSAPGQGSTFHVEFPEASAEELGRLETQAAPASCPAVPGKRVLVADDEEDIAELMARLIREDGDEVSVAHHGGEALKLLEAGAFDLLVTDFEMEHAKGSDLYAKLAEQGRLPATKVLFVTGDILNRKVLEFLSETGSEYMLKPFDIEVFRQEVRRLLAG